MPEWWTYSLSDFLLFSPRVYYRLIDMHNHALWPAHVLTLALGGGLLFLILRPTMVRDRAVFLILGSLWIWLGWSFFGERYASINWAALYVAPIFAIQGLLLIVAGLKGALIIPPAKSIPSLLGIGLFVLAVFGYPVVAPVFGRSWAGADVFGILPDPTVAATLAVLALARGWVRWPLMIVPVSWSLITAATLWAMDAGDFFIAPAFALAAAGVAAAMTVRPKQPPKSAAS